ncbi:MAG: thioredoxin domain-containing protein [Alphaproteobacteria bacterium]
MSANLLADETSPYLLQHKNNPVHWRPWGKGALEEAERTGKPILVSVGYSACHWCHVMAHESFEDAETAKLMNELFVNVKIDREERPDIDQMFQLALASLGETGGWPLTIFLTPRGEPFWGGTYFPKEDTAGRPSFRRVLNDIAKLVRENNPAVLKNSAQIREIFERNWNQSRAGGLTASQLNQIAVRVAQNYDIFFGGITGAPKFPYSASLELLLRAFIRTKLPQFDQLAAVTLDFMCQGGIYDHIGGGFTRYAVDERWLVPHFEKMLYDNAQLIDVLTLAWQLGRRPLHRQRVEETVGWILREMAIEGGGFASSIDADSEGEEGKFYLWTEAEIDAALAGTFLKRFKDTYGVTREGNYNGKNILNRLNAIKLLPEADETLLAKQREKLFQIREQRVRPHRDDKLLADWNGLSIAALANAGAVFRRSDWTTQAIRAFQFVCDKLSDEDRLFHSYRAGKRQVEGFADDYAHMARAALALWELTGDTVALKRAQAWTRVLNEHFWENTFGGYCLTADFAEPAHARIRTAFDSQTPSANGTMIGVLARLHLITGSQDYRDRANLLLQAFAGDVNAQYAQMATYINNFEFVAGAMQIVIVGAVTDARTHTLIQAVLGRPLPNRMLVVVGAEEELPASHPAHGKKMEGGVPTAYICTRSECSAPITSPVALSQAVLPSLPPPAPAQQPQTPPAQPRRPAVRVPRPTR